MPAQISDPQSQYCLSGGAECLDFTIDVFFTTYNGMTGILNIADIFDNAVSRSEPAAIFKRHHAHWYHVASAEEKSASALYSALESDNQLREVIKAVEFELATEYLITTGAIAERDGSFFGERTSLNLHIPTEAMIATPENINSVIRRTGDWAADFNRTTTRIANDALMCSTREVRLWLRDNIETQSCFIGSNRDVVDGKAQTTFKRNNIRAKKAIKRGLKLFKSVLGEHNVVTFLSGDSITISGDRYKYQIRKSTTNLIAHTMNPNGMHIPFTLSMLSHDNKLLCEMCVYFKDTPIIDQIVALSLYIKHKEDELLTVANFFQRTDEFWNDPISDSIPSHRRPTSTKASNQNYTSDIERRFHDEAARLQLRNDKIDEVVHRIRPTLRAAIPEAMGIDRNAFEFLRAPTFRFDQILEDDRLNIPIDSPIHRIEQLCHHLT